MSVAAAVAEAVAGMLDGGDDESIARQVRRQVVVAEVRPAVAVGDHHQRLGAGLFRHAERGGDIVRARTEEHTSELQSLMRISYAVFCLKKKIKYHDNRIVHYILHHNNILST